MGRKAELLLGCAEVAFGAVAKAEVEMGLAELAGAASEGQSGADIELACRNASLAAIREYLAIHKDKAETGEHLAIRMEHFQTAVSATADR